MRIIGGKHKGKKLEMPESTLVRPTADKVKQAIFTKFQFDIQNSKVLDVFSGSGALGIEAISRGASLVVFADNNVKSLNLVKRNVKSINENAQLLLADYQKTLNSLTEKFDFIILDPPYASGYYDKCFALIKQNGLLSKSGIVIAEHSASDCLSPEGYEKIDEKKYGTVCVSYFKIC